MKLKSCTRYSFKLVLALLCLISLSSVAVAEKGGVTLPDTCGSGWQIDGKPVKYDRDTLSERINGEAELYFPYGFDGMDAARYLFGKKAAEGVDVELYRLGSPLDAFGIYANYRQKEGRTLDIGTEANLSGAQIFFYQGRYFVHIQLTGTDSVDSNILSECARKVAALLPAERQRPPELKVLDRPEAVKGSERYLPESLLGYDFLGKGIMTDVVVAGVNFQIFLLLDKTNVSAAAVLDRYRSQLVNAKLEVQRKKNFFLKVAILSTARSLF